MGKRLKIALLALVGLFALAQFIQPSRTNPPSDPAASFEAVAKPPAQVTAIIERACKDCHSNRTEWPWYSRVAPASWLLADDVSGARRHFNFSEWGRMTPEKRLQTLGDICMEVTAGDMPLWQYRLLHPAARLQPGDVTALCQLSSRTQ